MSAVTSGSKRPAEDSGNDGGVKRPSLSTSGAATTSATPQQSSSSSSETSSTKSKTMKIPEGQVGLIIGKGGQIITHIQAVTRVNVMIPSEISSTGFREITLVGTDEKLIDKCEELIKQKLEHKMLPTMPAPMTNKPKTRVFVPDDQVGRIIGKGGSAIREIQEKTGALVFIPQECAEGSNLRELIVAGDQDQMAYCVAMIQKKTQNQSFVMPAETYEQVFNPAYDAVYKQAYQQNIAYYSNMPPDENGGKPSIESISSWADYYAKMAAAQATGFPGAFPNPYGMMGMPPQGAGYAPTPAMYGQPPPSQPATSVATPAAVPPTSSTVTNTSAAAASTSQPKPPATSTTSADPKPPA
eukprot:m.24547 g.24547  ORF g.24547 m.24547 type:complete len:356 (+) comp7617_c0_seq2:142-1209(+)